MRGLSLRDTRLKGKGKVISRAHEEREGRSSIHLPFPFERLPRRPNQVSVVRFFYFFFYFPQVKPSAFRAILQYLYTSRVHIDKEGLDNCIRLAHQCQMEHLKSQLQLRKDFIEAFGMKKVYINPALLFF